MQTHEKVDNLKSYEEKHQTAEKERSSKISRLKVKHQENIQ